MPYLPSPYKRFSKKHPELNEQYEKLALACHEAGPLDEKSRRLVKLGIAIGRQSEGAIKSHARRAIEKGASVEEVRHAALLAMTTMGFPGMIAAVEWIEEVIEAKEL
jgi:alkylhydroperoxidase/carboxymuconolactone decarboxylase family protein YurZ